ncbi:hypothetical protein TSAR_002890 [Trichomalopsis sarcophagae]|uniref:Uncharacterized protein n=1 Tax=Trichomalopsis sarcophagae TaxID=543379 RepID=A0A232EG36_9HYME|nr:hypothetical protein TSAR_002890 [Trichomalopsis sarcophagae]
MILGMDFCKKFDCDVRLGRGLWRTEEGEWRSFAHANSKEEATVYAECAGLSTITEEELAKTATTLSRSFTPRMLRVTFSAEKLKG